MQLYNTLTNTVEEVDPAADVIEMYSCGPTVYRFAHLGNLRTFLMADIIRRGLEFEGREVLQVMNITDVGHMVDESSAEAIDKMQLAAGDEGRSPAEIAATYTAAFLADADAIGIQRAHIYPKATDHIPEMLELTERLLAKGHAYVAETGTVYYDVASFEGYGKLSGNTLSALVPGHRDLETAPGKRHHADFALWKRAGDGRVQVWDSPWGPGFPGWHVECSAMSMKYLGDRFEVHTGGNDLKFPHHEDEIAQSEGAVGHEVVRLWAHGGHLRLAGQKIAKSSGNVVRVPELAEHGHDPLAFRYLTFQTRYRSEMDFSWEAMAAADLKVKQFRRRVAEWAGAGEEDVSMGQSASDADARFRRAVADDIDMPQAVVVLNQVIGADEIPDPQRLALLRAWDAILGLDLLREAHSTWAPTTEMLALVADRDRARSARDFESADGLREQLEAMDLEVMDTPDGTSIRPR